MMLLVLVCCGAIDDLKLGDQPLNIAKQQHLAGISGDCVRISGEKYFCIKGDIRHCPLRGEIDFHISRGRLQDLVDDESGGFCLEFDGTDNGRLFVCWNWLINIPNHIMLFGQLF